MSRRTPLQNPAESTTQAKAGDKKLSPELEGFIDRVLVPCLVKRYIRQLKEGKQPTWERDGVAAK